MTITEEPIPGEKPVIDPALPVDVLVGQYVKLRDRIKAAEAAEKEKMKPAKDYLQALNDRLLDALNQAGGDSIKTPQGTTYRTERKTASIADPVAFRDFVIANELFDVLDWKANAPAVADYIKEFGAEPPGIKYSIAYTVGVRRPGEA
jgi:hypothetical protein